MALDLNRTEKPLRKLRKLLKKMPTERGADDIHDFRTSSRRIEATLQALSPTVLESGCTLVHGSPRDPIWEYMAGSDVALRKIC